MLRHFDDRPILGIRRYFIVDSNEREKAPLPLYHSGKGSMRPRRTTVDNKNSALPIFCQSLGDTIDSEVAHLRFICVEHQIG